MAKSDFAGQPRVDSNSLPDASSVLGHVGRVPLQRVSVVHGMVSKPQNLLSDPNFDRMSSPNWTVRANASRMLLASEKRTTSVHVNVQCNVCRLSDLEWAESRHRVLHASGRSANL